MACAKNGQILASLVLKGKKNPPLCDGFSKWDFLTPKAKCLTRHLQGSANAFRIGDAQ